MEKLNISETQDTKKEIIRKETKELEEFFNNLNPEDAARIAELLIEANHDINKVLERKEMDELVNNLTAEDIANNLEALLEAGANKGSLDQNSLDELEKE